MRLWVEVGPRFWPVLLLSDFLFGASGKAGKSALIIRRILLCRGQVRLPHLKARLDAVKASARRLGSQMVRDLGNARLNRSRVGNAVWLVDSGCDDRDANNAIEALVKRRTKNDVGFLVDL